MLVTTLASPFQDIDRWGPPGMFWGKGFIPGHLFSPTFIIMSERKSRMTARLVSRHTGNNFSSLVSELQNGLELHLWSLWQLIWKSLQLNVILSWSWWCASCLFEWTIQSYSQNFWHCWFLCCNSKCVILQYMYVLFVVHLTMAVDRVWSTLIIEQDISHTSCGYGCTCRKLSQ